VLLVSLTIAWTTIFGIGHFGNTGLPIDYGIAQAQAVIIATAIGAHVLAALLAERRESEARLTRSNTTLEHERDNRLLNAQAITAAIAHEIRQPLAAITINADAALRWRGRTPPDHDEVRAALTRIKTGGHRASEVFDGFRSLFGKSGRERQPIDVNRIILEVTNSLQEELNGHGVEMCYELTTELTLVNGDGAQLGEVVLNLVNNAVEAMASTTNRSRTFRVGTEVCGRDEICCVSARLGTGSRSQGVG
jgi:C4-dicarboxylate-specific signal transduction histidine kinase